MTAETKTYFRPTNAETGAPMLTVDFTAALFEFGEAYKYDVDAVMADFVADVRDQLHILGLPIRPTIKQGRARVMQNTETDEDGYQKPAMFYSTVLAFLTDAEPDDPRLAALSNGFVGERTKVHVEFSIPTEESEAEVRAAIEEANERGRRYVAKASAERAERAEAAKRDEDPASVDMSDFFD